MPTIEFMGNELGPDTSVQVPAGGSVIDACDEADAPVAFSCRSASCGSCRVDVLAGGELLEPPEEVELGILDVFDASPTTRLACRLVSRAGPGLIRLVWMND